MMEKRHISRWVIGILLAMVCLLVVALVLKELNLLPRGAGSSTQVGSDVLVTSAENDVNFRDIKGKITLLNRSTGKQIWQEQMSVDSLPPVFADGLVYVVIEKPRGSILDKIDTLEALRLANGQHVWSWSWDMNMTIANAPVIKNGVIYLSESTYTDNTFTSPVSNAKYQSFVVALQASSGRQLWKDTLVGNLLQLTMADDGTLYVSNGAVVLALSSDNGQQRWQYAPPANDSLDYYTNAFLQETNYAIATQGQRVYVILRYSKDGVNTVADLVALNNQNGHEEWRYQMHADASFVPLLVDNDVVYLEYTRLPGGAFLVALNGGNGRVVWTYQQDEQDDMSQPLIVGDVLYMTENVLYLSANATPSRKVSDVVVLRRSDGGVVRRYAFSSKTSISVPVVSGNIFYLMVYTGTKNDTTITTAGAFDLRTGREIWSARIPQQAGGLRIMVSQGRVYVYSRALFVLQQGGGKQEWTFPSNVRIYHVVPDVG